MKLQVPYLSQLLDVKDEYWTHRACGAVSLMMVLQYYKKGIPDLSSWMDTLKEQGAFTQEKGWFYDGLAKEARTHGLTSRWSDSCTLEDLVEALESAIPVIVSVNKHLFNENRGHILVLTGLEKEHGELKGFYYHDPESLYPDKGAYAFVHKKDFLPDWKKRALFIAKGP